MSYVVKTTHLTVQLDHIDELIKLAAVGTITPKDRIKVLPAGDWIAAAELPELQEVWEGAAPLVPQPRLNKGPQPPSLKTVVGPPPTMEDFESWQAAEEQSQAEEALASTSLELLQSEEDAPPPAPEEPPMAELDEGYSGLRGLLAEEASHEIGLKETQRGFRSTLQITPKAAKSELSEVDDEFNMAELLAAAPKAEPSAAVELDSAKESRGDDAPTFSDEAQAQPDSSSEAVQEGSDDGRSKKKKSRKARNAASELLEVVAKEEKQSDGAESESQSGGQERPSDQAEEVAKKTEPARPAAKRRKREQRATKPARPASIESSRASASAAQSKALADSEKPQRAERPNASTPTVKLKGLDIAQAREIRATQGGPKRGERVLFEGEKGIGRWSDLRLTNRRIWVEHSSGRFHSFALGAVDEVGIGQRPLLSPAPAGWLLVAGLLASAILGWPVALAGGAAALVWLVAAMSWQISEVVIGAKGAQLRHRIGSSGVAMAEARAFLDLVEEQALKHSEGELVNEDGAS